MVVVTKLIAVSLVTRPYGVYRTMQLDTLQTQVQVLIQEWEQSVEAVKIDQFGLRRDRRVYPLNAIATNLFVDCIIGFTDTRLAEM